MVYMHMVKGSPCIVPSWEKITSLSVKRGPLLQYVFATILMRCGQRDVRRTIVEHV